MIQGNYSDFYGNKHLKNLKMNKLKKSEISEKWAYLFVRLEYITLEYIGGAITCYVAEDLEILRIMGHVKYPEKQTEMNTLN